MIARKRAMTAFGSAIFGTGRQVTICVGWFGRYLFLVDKEMSSNLICPQADVLRPVLSVFNDLKYLLFDLMEVADVCEGAGVKVSLPTLRQSQLFVSKSPPITGPR
jgi:hypothetical protein